jgi:putative chitinase
MTDPIGASGRPLAVTDEQLTRIVGFGAPAPGGTADEINAVVAAAKILTHLELAHFIAQCCYESAYFRQYVEPEVPGRYEFRSDLGNTAPGDGQRYPGRGAIQLTGRNNYEAFGQWLGGVAAAEGFGPGVSVDVLANPDAVGEAPLRWLAAAWFWSTHPGLQRAADNDDVPACTAIITGARTPGLNQGLAQRERLTNNAIQELG